MQKLILAACLAAASLSPSLAADPAPRPSVAPAVPVATKPDWTIDLGAGAIFAPKFPGAKQGKVMPIPFFALNYKDTVFASVNDGLGVNIINAYGFKAGPVLKFAFPRRERDDRRYLRGLGDVDATLEGGAFLSYTLDPYLTTKLEVRKGIASLGGGSRNKSLAAIGINQKAEGHDGIIADLSVDFNLPPLFEERLFLSAGPRLSYYDKDYARSYFGVSASQARVSNFAVYNPKAGISKAGVGGAAIFALTRDVSLTAFADYGRFIGDIAKSPLVRGRDGSPNQFTLGTGVTYRFSL
jgi:MipA family protein